VPANWNNVLYYVALVVLVGGSIIGVAWALRARREAREGVDFISEADMLTEFQRARDAGEMDDAEFRRVRDLLISGKSSKGVEQREFGPNPGVVERPPNDPPSGPPTPTDPERAPSV